MEKISIKINDEVILKRSSKSGGKVLFISARYVTYLSKSSGKRMGVRYGAIETVNGILYKRLIL